MGMMAKMRSLAPWFIITVGGLFVLFMVISDSQVMEMLGRRSRYIGSINGDDITYQDFSALVEQARQRQSQMTGEDVAENQMDELRNQVWEQLISQKLIQEQMDKYGITVTDDEIRDAILGENPPAFLKQNFIDSTGNFNREAYLSAVSNPQNKDVMIQAEEQVKQQLAFQKLQSLLNASINISEDEIQRKYIDDNIKMSADFVFINSVTMNDSLVQVTEDDLQAYYNENLDNYKIETQRKLKYVLFRNIASQRDSLDLENNLKMVAQKLKEDTSTFKTYVEIYSDNPYSLDTVGVGLLQTPAVDLLQNANKGDVVGPVMTSEGYVLYRLVNKFQSSETFVRASHILIRQSQNPDSSKQFAERLYERLKAGEDFATLAKEYSEDPGSAQRGGDLSWFSRGQMVPEFENACFTGKTGVVQKPIETNYGYHIIKVTGRSNEKYVIEKIVNKIVPSASTLEDLYDKAADFSYVAKEDGFEQAAGMLGYSILNTPGFKEKDPQVPGLGINKAVNHFTFENSVGEISDVFKVQVGYIVAMVSEIIKPGFKEFSEVKMSLEPLAKREKKKEKAREIAEQIKNKIDDSGNLNVAKQIYPNAVVSIADNFTASASIPGVGKDYAFSEYCLNGEINKISNPVAGTRGSYLIRIKNRTKFDSTAYSLRRNTLRDAILNTKKARIANNWIQSLKDEADIEDNRYMFYR